MRIPNQHRLIHAGFASRKVISDILNIPVPDSDFFVSLWEALCSGLQKRHVQVVGQDPKRGGGAFNRHSPNPDKAKEYIIQNGLQVNPVNREDTLCLNCYKLHLAISENEHHPSDKRLLSFISSALNDASKVDVALAATCSVLAQHFLKEKAMLLPEASRVFLLAYFGDEVPINNRKIETEDSTVTFTNQWLLHQIIIKFGQEELCYKCSHPKLGTVLYRRGADLPPVWHGL